jgi:hypothetical protein
MYYSQPVIKPLKATVNLSYIETFSSHREVNTLRLGYKTQSIDEA